MEDVGIFYDHLVYLTALCYSYCVTIWYSSWYSLY
jgi:hypothetical protein